MDPTDFPQPPPSWVWILMPMLIHYHFRLFRNTRVKPQAGLTPLWRSSLTAPTWMMMRLPALLCVSALRFHWTRDLYSVLIGHRNVLFVALGELPGKTVRYSVWLDIILSCKWYANRVETNKEVSVAGTVIKSLKKRKQRLKWTWQVLATESVK